MASLKENAVSLISSTDVPFDAVAAVTLFTVPTGKLFIPVLLVVRVGDDAAVTIVSVGRVGSLTDFLPNQTLSNLDADGDMGILQPVPAATPLMLKTYAAGVVFQMDVTTAVGNASNDVDLFGYLVDAP